MSAKLFCSLVLCFFSVSLYLQGANTDSSTSVSFPSQVTVKHEGKTYQLEATGVATRKKFSVKVYTIASYLEKGTVTNKNDAFAQILEDNKAKQLTTKWAHEVSASKIQNTYQESFSKVLSGEDYANLQKEIDTFVGFFTADAKVGDEQIIRWLPGGYIEVLINGKSTGNITNVALAKAVFGLWFGPSASVNRNDLIKDLK